MRKIILLFCVVGETYSFGTSPRLVFLGEREGFSPSRQSRIYDINNDASVIVGGYASSSYSSRLFPCKWNLDNIAEFLLDPSEHASEYNDGFAAACNDSGSIIVGNFDRKAFQWTEESSIQYILPPLDLFGIGNRYWEAVDVNEFGMIVGNSTGPGRNQFNYPWPDPEQFSQSFISFSLQSSDVSYYHLCPMMGFRPTPYAKILGMSRYGNKIFGTSTYEFCSNSNYYKAFKYENSSWLSISEDFTWGSYVKASSSNGSVIGGWSGYLDGGFIKTPDYIHFLGTDISIYALSGDGFVAVGGSGLSAEAIIWTKPRGIISVDSLILSSFSSQIPLTIGDWGFVERTKEATCISSDGTCIGGNTVHGHLISNAFVLTGLSLLNDHCPCDFNKDGQVDDSDFVIFVVAYNNLLCPNAVTDPLCRMDINLDGLVDDADFSLFVVAYNKLECE